MGILFFFFFNAAIPKHLFPGDNPPLFFLLLFFFNQYFNHCAQFNVRKGNDDLPVKGSGLNCRTVSA